MKGLIQNNLFATYSNVKVFSIFMVLSGVFVIAIANQSLLFGYMLLGMIGFPVNALASIKNEYASKWGKYKLTLPVKRSDIIKSYYLNQIIWILVGILFAAIGMGLSWILHGCPFDNQIDIFPMLALGISISLFTVAVFYTLFYLGGAERSEVFIVISLLIAIGIDLAIVAIINELELFDRGTPNILLGSAILIACSVLTFCISHPITIRIFKRKEY